jgi:hypothetical protein
MTDKASIVDQIADRYASYFEHPSEVAAVLMGLSDAHERADAAIDLHVALAEELCRCKPLLLERVDVPDQPVCWVHTIDCEVAHDPDVLDAWAQRVTAWMAQTRGRPVLVVTGEVTGRTVLARLDVDGT